jgi:hypothetical protein
VSLKGGLARSKTSVNHPNGSCHWMAIPRTLGEGERGLVRRAIRLAALARRKGVGMILDNEDELLTPAEVAALLRVTSRTVPQWANTGQGFFNPDPWRASQVPSE